MHNRNDLYIHRHTMFYLPPMYQQHPAAGLIRKAEESLLLAYPRTLSMSKRPTNVPVPSLVLELAEESLLLAYPRTLSLSKRPTNVPAASLLLALTINH